MLHPTIPLGHLAGIRLGAHWSVLVTMGLFTWLLGISLARNYGNSPGVWLSAACGAIVLLATLLAHEVAHSLVAQRNGVPVHQVVLWLLGGVSELSAEPEDARSDLQIALAGPLASLALGVGLGGVSIVVGLLAAGPASAALAWTAAMNLLLAVFNLLPGAPLDGGRVLRAVLWRRTGDQLRAAGIAARWGRAMGMGFALVGAAELVLFGNPGGLWLMLLGWFLFTTAATELAVAGLRHRLGDLRVRDIMTAPVATVEDSWTVAELLASEVPDSRHQVFPVVDSSGHPMGVLAWSDLVAVPPSKRQQFQVSRFARPLPARARAHADDRLSEAAAAVALRPDLDVIAVVDSEERVIGVVTATDVALACRRSELGLDPARTSRRQTVEIPTNTESRQ